MKATAETVQACLPDLGALRAPGWSGHVTRIWLEAWEESVWARLEDCPYNALSTARARGARSGSP